MDIHPHDANPTCDHIARACTMYSAGASPKDIRDAFSAELTELELSLLWCAAVSSFNVDERLFPE